MTQMNAIGLKTVDGSESISTNLLLFAFICGKKEFPMEEPNRCYRYFATVVVVGTRCGIR